MNRLRSAYVTMALFLGMTLYLLQGKFMGGKLDPRVMLALAGILFLQGSWALISRLAFIARMDVRPTGRFTPRKARLYPMPIGRLEAELLRQGFVEGDAGRGGVRFFSRGVRKSLVVEAIVYVGLLVLLAFGMINYGLGIQGRLEITPGGEWIDLKRTPSLTQGFLVPRTKGTVKVRGTALTYSGPEGVSRISLEFTDDGDGRTVPVVLNAGDTSNIAAFAMRYLGDALMVFSGVMEKNHDYLAGYTRLFRTPGSAEFIYQNAVPLNEPGTRGEMQYDPVSDRCEIRIFKEENLIFDRTFPSCAGQQVEGDLNVTIRGTLHYGALQISHRTYRVEVLLGLALMLTGLLARLVLRRGEIFVWAEGDGTYVSTESRALRRILDRAKSG